MTGYLPSGMGRNTSARSTARLPSGSERPSRSACRRGFRSSKERQDNSSPYPWYTSFAVCFLQHFQRFSAQCPRPVSRFLPGSCTRCTSFAFHHVGQPKTDFRKGHQNDDDQHFHHEEPPDASEDLGHGNGVAHHPLDDINGQPERRSVWRPPPPFSRR